MTTVFANARLEGLEYRFSLERLEELSRSPAPLLLARLSPDCPSYRKAPTGVVNPSDLIDEIRAHCVDDPDYIRQWMPLQEIVFRTLLLADDQTMTLGEIHRELTERWSSPVRPITVTIAGLARILDSDEFYGFEPVAAPETEDSEESDAEPDTPMLPAAGTALAPAFAEEAGLGDAEDDDYDEDLDEDDPYDDDDADDDDD